MSITGSLSGSLFYIRMEENMKKLLLPALLAIALTANAAETVKTPHGTLSFILDDSPAGDMDKIALNGKPIGEFTNYGYPDFNEKPYRVGNQDIYIFNSGAGVASSPEEYYSLVIFEKDKKPRVITDDEFWGIATFKIAQGKLTGDLGLRDKKRYFMSYDGNKITITSQASKKANLSEQDCKEAYKNREEYCDENKAQWAVRSVIALYDEPGFNNNGFEKFCNNKKKIKKTPYKTFKAMVCHNP